MDRLYELWLHFPQTGVRAAIYIEFYSKSCFRRFTATCGKVSARF